MGNLHCLIKTQGAQFVKIDNSGLYILFSPVEEPAAWGILIQYPDDAKEAME
jgi:hypothetical protein